MEWEESKENYVPLKAGRKPGALKEASVTADVEHKQELETRRK